MAARSSTLVRTGLSNTPPTGAHIRSPRPDTDIRDVDPVALLMMCFAVDLDADPVEALLHAVQDDLALLAVSAENHATPLPPDTIERAVFRMDARLEAAREFHRRAMKA